jgi:hypothetical protein
MSVHRTLLARLRPLLQQRRVYSQAANEVDANKVVVDLESNRADTVVRPLRDSLGHNIAPMEAREQSAAAATIALDPQRAEPEDRQMLCCGNGCVNCVAVIEYYHHPEESRTTSAS